VRGAPRREDRDGVGCGNRSGFAAAAIVAQRLLNLAPHALKRRARLTTERENSMRNQQTTDNRLELAMTYSAYREMELVPRTAADHVSEAILDLAQNPRPEEAVMLEDAKGCYYLAVDGWYILYHLTEALDCLTILGVLDGPEHTVH
jgi:hypothetical protein